MYHIPDFGWIKEIKAHINSLQTSDFFFPFPFTFEIINSRILSLFCFPFGLIHSASWQPFGGELGCFNNAPYCCLKLLGFPSGPGDLEDGAGRQQSEEGRGQGRGHKGGQPGDGAP